jgi:hypothetical protein
MRERDHTRVGANELPVGSLRKDIGGTAEKQAENEESGSHCFRCPGGLWRFWKNIARIAEAASQCDRSVIDSKSLL